MTGPLPMPPAASGEFVDDSGERLEVVREPQAPDGLGQAQREKLFSLYQAVAREMPLEGRDYRISASPGKGSSLSVSLIPLNEFGEVWCRHLASRLREEFGKGQAQAQAQGQGQGK